MSRPIASAKLVSTAGVLFLVTGFEEFGFAQERGLDARLSRRWRVSCAIGIVTTLVATRARAIGCSAKLPRTGRATRSSASSPPRSARSSEFLTRADGARRAGLRRPVQVLRCLCRHDDDAVRDRSRLHAQRLCDHRQGCRPRRDADRRLCRRHGGARLSARRQPLDRAASCRRVQSRLQLAVCRRPEPLGADRRDHRGEFHRRDRHRDLRRLSVGVVPIAAAHRDAIRAADRARRRSAAHICRRVRASSPKPPAGSGSSWSRVLVAIPSFILLAWLQARGHFAENLGKPTVVAADD